MANLLTTGATWLGEQLQAIAGSTVDVYQGQTKLDDLTATLVTCDYEVVDAEGFLTKVTMHNWTFVADDLGDLEFRPGALIVHSGTRYEACPVGNRPCSENLDASGVLITVHTKKLT